MNLWLARCFTDLMVELVLVDNEDLAIYAEQKGRWSSLRIQVHYLGTISKWCMLTRLESMSFLATEKDGTMKKVALISAVVLITFAMPPAFSQHSFWHQVKDQVYNRHGWQYGYGQYPPAVNYYGTGYGYSNPWGTYGVQQGWGHAQYGRQYGGHEYREHHGGYHHD